VVAAETLARAEQVLCEAGFTAERHEWSVNFTSKSSVSLQLSTEDFYRDFPARAVAADVHGILMRVASLKDTLAGKIKAYSDPGRRQSKRIKDLADIVRLVEAHPELRATLPPASSARSSREFQGASPPGTEPRPPRGRMSLS